MQVEQNRQLTVDRARAQTKAFTDQLAFRRKLRGIFSLMSGGFKGFPQASPANPVKPPEGVSTPGMAG